MKKVHYDIIMFALPRWDGRYSSTAYSLAQSLSAYTRIFYIDNPFTIKDFVSHNSSDQIQRRRSALLGTGSPFVAPVAGNANLIAVTPHLTLPINWLPAGPLYDLFSRFNERAVTQIIRKIRREYNVGDFVFINSFNPLFARRLPGDLTPLLSIYHCVDDISNSEYVSRHGTRLEDDAIKKADLTLVTSLELKRLKQNTAKKVYYLPNAANVELFQRAFVDVLERPVELRNIPDNRKVILYMGNICHRLDYELLKKVAKKHSDKILLMVGPQSTDQYKSTGLANLDNVIFTGAKPLQELPAFVAHSHCCIIPFLKNALTRSIYPLKVNEYLSGGKPVITTDFSEDIVKFEAVVYVSANHEEFVDAIDRGISTDHAAKAKERVDFAAGNNWDSRAAELLEIVNRNLKMDGRAA